MIFKCEKSPSEELTLTNRIFFNPSDWNANDQYVQIICNGKKFHFKSDVSELVSRGYCTMGANQRRWVYCGVGETVECIPLRIRPDDIYLLECHIELDFLSKKNIVKEPIDTEKLATKWMERFMLNPVTLGQPILFVCDNIKYEALIKTIKVINMQTQEDVNQALFGILMNNSIVKFGRSKESPLLLSGRFKDDSQTVNILNAKFDFNSIGVGGIDKQFNEAFRRTFVSRLLPPDLSEKLNMKHVRGILLYGPPGTGKTLLARQIGKMLNSREPKIVNGPSILDKYVGESEANIRKLFADAEEEFKRMGNNSALHLIIFDEIDAICKARSSMGGGSAVQDTVVNQLLSKMDGVEQLNNILIIGMTNRRDLIDEALLRPGRIEVQLEISLPDEHGRLQILDIHTKKLRENKKLGSDVSLTELATLTKNFSGAEIEGLVKAAINNALSEKLDPQNMTCLKREDFNNLVVKRSFFMYALEHDIVPYFGKADDEVEQLSTNQMVIWGSRFSDMLNQANVIVNSLRSDDDTKVFTGKSTKKCMLLSGPAASGLSTIASKLAKQTGFQYIKFVSPASITGYSESSKSQAIKKHFDDALKAPSAVIVLDKIERFLDYSPIGPRYSASLVTSLNKILNCEVPADKKLLIICTTNNLRALKQLKLFQILGLHSTLQVPLIKHAHEAASVLFEQEIFTDDEVNKATILLQGLSRPLDIGVKQLVRCCRLLRNVAPEKRLSGLMKRLTDYVESKNTPIRSH